ncbi:unnamed protein product, partial [Symbiodinium pilosum]
MEQITWSLNQLAIGIHPEKDFSGNPYRGRYAPGTQIAGWCGRGNAQLPAKMICLCGRFKAWASANQLSTPATMTAGMLGWEGGAYPSLNLKAWNSRLILSYFELVLREMLRQIETSDMDGLLIQELRLASAATTAMASFMDQMERAGRYLEPSEARAMDDACHTFLNLYEILILLSLRRGRPRWKA